MTTLDKLKIFSIGGKKYINLLHLKQIDIVERCVGVKATVSCMRGLMEIPEGVCIGAKTTKGFLTEIEPSGAKSFYVKLEWASAYIQTMENEMKEELEISESDFVDPDYLVKERVPIKICVVDAPPKIVLGDCDALIFGGSRRKIDIRGTSDETETISYFSLGNVAKFMGIRDHADFLRRQKDKGIFMFGYEYVKFRVRTVVEGRRITQVKTYLTFEGMLRLAAAGKKPRCLALFRWVARKASVITSGTPAARMKMAEQITGLGLQQAYKLLASSPTIFEGLYSFIISRNIGEMQEQYDFWDLIEAGEVFLTDLLVKLGRAAKHLDTEEKEGRDYGIARRFGEHIRNIEQLPGVETEIISFGVIQDREYVEAENEARKLLRGMARKVKIPGRREFFFLPEEKLEDFKRGLIKIIKDHEVTSDELFVSIEKKDRKIELLNKDIENLKEKAANERRRRKAAEARIEEQAERIEEQSERIEELRAMNKILQDANTEKAKTIKKLRARLE